MKPFTTVAVVAVLHGGAALAAKPTSLPRTKVNVEPCMQAVLARHPGTIEKFQVRYRDEALYFRIEVQEQEGPEWVILCDGLTGKIAREQKLDDVWP